MKIRSRLPLLAILVVALSLGLFLGLQGSSSAAGRTCTDFFSCLNEEKNKPSNEPAEPQDEPGNPEGEGPTDDEPSDKPTSPPTPEVPAPTPEPATTTSTASPTPVPQPKPTETVTTTTTVQLTPPPTETVTAIAVKPVPSPVAERPDICTNHPGLKSLPNSRWIRLENGSCEIRNPNADVAVTEQVDPKVVHVGDTVTYTIVIINHGEGEAPGVGLEKLVPPGLELLTPNDVDCGNGNRSVAGGVGSQVIRCDFSMIDLHESVTVTIRMKATSTGKTSGQVEVGTDKRSDQNMGNNRDAAVVEVSAPTTKPTAPNLKQAKPMSVAGDRTGYITVKTPGYEGDAVSFVADVFTNKKGAIKMLPPVRIFNNNTARFTLPSGATSMVKFNGAKCAGWHLEGTKLEPLHWMYTAIRVAVSDDPKCKERQTTKPRSEPAVGPKKATTPQFVWVIMNMKNPDGSLRCGKYVRLRFYPDGGGVAPIGKRTTCTATKLVFRRPGNLCVVASVSEGVQVSKPCTRIYFRDQRATFELLYVG